jgi:rRNA maturation RNase YbeY
MPRSKIHYFSEDITFSLPSPSFVSEWIISVIHSENFKLKSLNIIFCSDQFLLDINKQFLKHDYYTDIITFDNSDLHLTIEGDLYISIHRVTENAIISSSIFIDELHRVMIHGVLHLIGYSDHYETAKLAMRLKEDSYLNLRKF